MSRQIFNRSCKVDGIDVFYREAGDEKNPSILLLHGFPSTSAMFKDLMTALSDRFHLVAPDYPGFGFSTVPDKDHFEYTFKNIAAILNKLTDEINMRSFTIFLHDYGAAVGLQLCIKHPEKIAGIIVLNGNAYNEGIESGWDEMRDYWRNPTPEKKAKVYAFLSEEGTKSQYYSGLPSALFPRISPELWMLDWHFLSRPGHLDIHYVLNCDWENHINMYHVFQEYFRVHQPPALIIWGKHDPYFNAKEAHCYKRDLPDADVHVLDGAHMLVESHFDEVQELIGNFLSLRAS